MLWGRAKFRLGRAGNLNSLASTGQRLWSSKFWFVFLVACLWLFSDKHEGDTCVREAMHGVGAGVGVGVGASVKFSCATLDILLVLSYARNPKWRENLLSSLTALPVQWLITNEAIKWLLTKCLSARLSNVSKFQCAVSASQICTTASAGCFPPSSAFHTHSLWHVPHVCHTLVTCVFITVLCLSWVPLRYRGLLLCGD